MVLIEGEAERLNRREGNALTVCEHLAQNFASVEKVRGHFTSVSKSSPAFAPGTVALREDNATAGGRANLAERAKGESGTLLPRRVAIGNSGALPPALTSAERRNATELE